MTSFFNVRLGSAACVAVLALTSIARADQASSASQQSMEELRNTVVNILEAMVQKGLITADQAKQMVQQAKDRAAASAAAESAKSAAEAQADEGAVRVPYVPQIVKDEIAKQVAAEVRPAVIDGVVAEAKTERWGVPGATPEWLAHVRVTGDMTARLQANMYPSDNNPQIPDYNAINQAGGFDAAAFPFLDTTHNRDYLRLRARLGADVTLSPNWTAAIRLSSGSLTDPSSPSQNEGTYGGRYSVGIDQAYIRWNEAPAGKFSWASGTFGRQPDPWFSPTELVFARDLTFEGVSGTMRTGWGVGDDRRTHLWLTAGAVPMLEVPEIPSQNKWLIGGQLGLNWRLSANQQLRLGAAEYYFRNVTGVANVIGGPNENGTAPAFIRYGNTVYPISNGLSTTQQLFGLAAHFRVADAALSYEWNLGSRQLVLNGEFARNLGYHEAQVIALADPAVPPPKAENVGYVAEIGYGDATVTRFLDWRARFGYRYVRADAVIDAWTDADFHGGGTNAQGYYAWGELGVGPNTWLRLRYMSANEVDGPKFGLDIVQLDLNARF